MAVRVDDVDLIRDAALVERFQQGDGGAFADLYRRYFDRLRRYCQRRVGDPATAEEIAQEAFTRALRALPRFSGERRFYPWMTVIAQRLCADHHRAQARTVPTSEVDDLRQVGPAHEAVLHEVELTHLDEALHRVRGRHRRVLNLRDFDGLSYREIAEALEVPVTTVHALLHRARLALRREFEAVSGEGRLGAVPLLAFAVRGWQRLKARVASWSTHHGVEGAAGAGSLAAAVAVGALAVLPGSPPAPAPDTADRVVVTAPVAPGPTPSSPAPAARDRSAERADAASPASTPHPHPSPERPDPRASAGPVDVYVGPSGSERARDEAEGMTVSAVVGPVFAGVDSDQIVDDAAQLAPTLGGQP